MSSKQLVEMFEGDSADMCAGNIPLVLMGYDSLRGEWTIGLDTSNDKKGFWRFIEGTGREYQKDLYARTLMLWFTRK